MTCAILKLLSHYNGSDSEKTMIFRKISKPRPELTKVHEDSNRKICCHVANLREPFRYLTYCCWRVDGQPSGVWKSFSDFVCFQTSISSRARCFLFLSSYVSVFSLCLSLTFPPPCTDQVLHSSASFSFLWYYDKIRPPTAFLKLPPLKVLYAPIMLSINAIKISF